MHLHLNLSGGLTGDMFIAAVLDAFPRFEQRVIAAIDALDDSYPVVCSLLAHSGGEMSGHRFEIEPFVNISDTSRSHFLMNRCVGKRCASGSTPHKLSRTCVCTPSRFLN